MPIPARLKSSPIWTLSNREKMPLDTNMLYTQGIEMNYYPEHGSRCYTYDICKKVQEKYPETLMTIRPRPEDGITVVDIEPEGNHLDNPYMYLDFIYTELSSSGGIHGILDYQIEMKTIQKDKERETEFFQYDHFTIITENEIPLPEAKYHLFDFMNQLKQNTITTYEYKDIEIHISPILKARLDQLKINKFKIKPSDDKSQVEFRYLMHIGYKVHKIVGHHNFNQFVECIEYLSEKHMPYRDKHNTVGNYAEYGAMSWRKYTTIKAAEYVIEHV